MSTGLDLLTGSLRLLGVLASGESASASEATEGLSSLNALIDSWSNENLLIPNKVREVFPLVAGKQTYTIGTGGDFNTSRPQDIENALIQLVGTTPNLELPMRILNQDEYANTILKAVQSTFPMEMYNDGGYPISSINVWPVPTETDNIVFYSWKPLANVATLTTSISLPPGYLRALKFNLAVDLAPEYGRQLSDVVATIAVESKAAIKRMNISPRYLRVDDAVMGKSAVWDYRTGEPT